MKIRSLFIVAYFLPVIAIAQSNHIPFVSTYYSDEKVDTIDEKTADDLFKKIKESEFLEYKYPQGDCHYRAHFAGLMLRKEGIKTYKIWNFSPNYFNLTEKNGLIIKDPNNLTDDSLIHWDFHVAPVLFVRRKSIIDTLVVDPALFPFKMPSYKEWLNAQAASCSYFTFMNMKYMNFQTSNKYFKNSGSSIITGAFWTDDNTTITGKWVETGICRCKVAYLYYQTEIVTRRKELAKLLAGGKKENAPEIEKLEKEIRFHLNIAKSVYNFSDSGANKPDKKYLQQVSDCVNKVYPVFQSMVTAMP